MKPKDPTRIAVPPRRAAIRLGVDSKSGSHVVGVGGSHFFRDRDALLSFLTSYDQPRSFSQLWLSPHSPGDWAQVIVPLAKKGWALGVTRRRGQFSSLFVYKPGSIVPAIEDEDDNPFGAPENVMSGRMWSGRSAAGLAVIPKDLSPHEECRAVLDQIEAIDLAIRQRFPAVTLGTSLTSTGIGIFRTMLDREMLVDPQVEVSLRRSGAVGGGRQEIFCAPGAIFEATEKIDPKTGEVELEGAPCDLDLGSAYPTALERVPVGAEFIGLGGPSSALDPCTISLALVEVPSAIRIAPLRYEPTDGSASCYPTGFVFGAWSALQLRVAEKLGCTILRVHTTWRFRPDECFQRFGDAMRVWRKELGPDLVGNACKQLAVRVVGAWLMAPRESEIWVGEPPPDRIEGARVLGRELWELSVPTKQHPSAALPAGIMTISAVQAWSALLLGTVEEAGAQPIYWHTDGGAFEAAGPAVDLVRRAAEAGRDVHFPTMDRWRFRAMRKIQVWAPSQRYEVDADGHTRVAGSGLSDALSEEDLMGRSDVAETVAKLDLLAAGRRVWVGPTTRAPHMREVDRGVHDAVTHAVLGEKKEA